MKKSIVYFFGLLAVWAALCFMFMTAQAKPLDKEHIIPGKCATFLSPDVKNKIAKVYDADTNSNYRPICQAQYHSPNGRFLIHFDTSGVHAVDLTDLNVNGVPDYVDSVAYYIEYIAKAYIDREMPSPYPDDGKGGDSCFDVYLKNIGDGDLFPIEDFDRGGLYGWARRGGEVGNSIPAKYKSFIVVDNDYSERDSVRNEPGPGEMQGRAVRPAYKEFGILGMKISAAHEYCHAVQFLYGADSRTGDMLAEMTSTYMEYTVFPESRDHKQYVNRLMKSPDEYPFGRSGAEAGYGYCIFLSYITAKYGENSINRIWEYMGQNNSVYKSLDLFFRDKNTSLDSAWMNFIPWLYYTGSRAKPGYLPFAADYKELVVDKIIKYDEMSANEYNGSLSPFQFSLARYTFNHGNEFTDDTLDVIVTSTDMQSANICNINATNSFNSTVTTETEGQKVNERRAEIFNYDPPKFFSFISDYEFGNFRKFESPGMRVEVFTGAYPSPLQLKRDLIVYFPVPENVLPFTLCNLEIRDLSGMTLFSHDYKSGVYNGKKAILMETSSLPDTITTGVYLFSVEADESRIKGKIAIKEN